MIVTTAAVPTATVLTAVFQKVKGLRYA